MVAFFDIVDIVIKIIKTILKALFSILRYSNDMEVATISAINNTNTIRYARLKIDSWSGYRYHFQHAKVFKELFEKRGGFRCVIMRKK